MAKFACLLISAAALTALGDFAPTPSMRMPLRELYASPSPSPPMPNPSSKSPCAPVVATTTEAPPSPSPSPLPSTSNAPGAINPCATVGDANHVAPVAPPAPSAASPSGQPWYQPLVDFFKKGEVNGHVPQVRKSWTATGVEHVAPGPAAPAPTPAAQLPTLLPPSPAAPAPNGGGFGLTPRSFGTAVKYEVAEKKKDTKTSNGLYWLGGAAVVGMFVFMAVRTFRGTARTFSRASYGELEHGDNEELLNSLE